MTRRERTDMFFFELKYGCHPPMHPNDIRLTGKLPVLEHLRYPINPELLAAPRPKEIA